MRWFDSHCHLHICEEDVPVGDLVERARADGVDRILAVGIDVRSSERALEIARSHPGVMSSAGLHPNSAHDWNDETRARVERLFDDPLVRAVGETGLDFYRDSAPPKAQREAFGAHVEMAKKHDRALVIHTRDSVEGALDMLEASGAPARLVFHCWGGDDASLRRALALGSYVSFAGNVSFKSAENLRAAARLVPSDRVLVETDSPYLAPVPNRGKPNEPAFVVHVGAAVAAARGESVEDIAELTSRNAETLFLS